MTIRGRKSTRKTIRKILMNIWEEKFTSTFLCHLTINKMMVTFLTVDAVIFLLLNCITEYCNYSHSFSVLLQMKSLP